MSQSTHGWHTLHGTGRRLATEGDTVYVGAQFRTQPDGGFGYRFYEELDSKQRAWMVLALDEHRSIVGQVFGPTKKQARRAMDVLFQRKGLGSSGLSF